METKKEIKIRQLKSTDVFMMAKILTEIGFREFKEVFIDAKNNYDTSKKDKATAVEAVGFVTVLDAAGVIIANLNKAEKSIFEFISSLTGEDVKTLKEMPLNDFVALINEIVHGDSFGDFFEAVTSLFK